MRDFSVIKKRILQYLEFKGITEYKFHQDTGITNGILSQSNGLSEDNILKFLSGYPDISPDWLLTGRGSMERVGGVQVEGVSISGSNEISGSTIVGNGCSDRCELVRMLTRQTDAQNAQILKLLEMVGKPLKRD